MSEVHVGTCGYCNRFPFHLDDGRLSDHGYRVKEVRQGNCPGAGELALELSPKTASMLIDDLRSALKRTEKAIDRWSSLWDKDFSTLSIIDNKKEITFKAGTPSHRSRIDQEIANLKSKLRYYQSDLTDAEKTVRDWDGPYELQTKEVIEQSERAKKSAASEERAAKRAAKIPKAVARLERASKNFFKNLKEADTNRQRLFTESSGLWEIARALSDLAKLTDSFEANEYLAVLEYFDLPPTTTADELHRHSRRLEKIALGKSPE